MQFLFSTYVEEFNVRHTRRGTLVQGRYKATLVESEEHFLACLEYFANNPVAAGLCDRPQDWPWSSYAGDGELAPRAERLLRSDLDIVFRQGPDMSRWDTTGSDPDTSRADGWLSRPCWRRRSRRRRRSAPPSTDP
jgi:hypothetical protein